MVVCFALSAMATARHDLSGVVFDHGPARTVGVIVFDVVRHQAAPFAGCSCTDKLPVCTSSDMSPVVTAATTDVGSKPPSTS